MIQINLYNLLELLKQSQLAAKKHNVKLYINSIHDYYIDKIKSIKIRLRSKLNSNIISVLLYIDFTSFLSLLNVIIHPYQFFNSNLLFIRDNLDLLFYREYFLYNYHLLYIKRFGSFYFNIFYYKL